MQFEIAFPSIGKIELPEPKRTARHMKASSKHALFCHSLHMSDNQALIIDWDSVTRILRFEQWDGAQWEQAAMNDYLRAFFRGCIYELKENGGGKPRGFTDLPDLAGFQYL